MDRAVRVGLVCSGDVPFLIAVPVLRGPAVVVPDTDHAPVRLVATILVLQVPAERLAAGPCIPRVPVQRAPLVRVPASGRRVPAVLVDGLASVHAREWVDLRVQAA